MSVLTYLVEKHYSSRKINEITVTSSSNSDKQALTSIMNTSNTTDNMISLTQYIFLHISEATTNMQVLLEGICHFLESVPTK
jgi:hypothetical protein